MRWDPGPLLHFLCGWQGYVLQAGRGVPVQRHRMPPVEQMAGWFCPLEVVALATCPGREFGSFDRLSGARGAWPNGGRASRAAPGRRDRLIRAGAIPFPMDGHYPRDKYGVIDHHKGAPSVPRDADLPGAHPLSDGRRRHRDPIFGCVDHEKGHGDRLNGQMMVRAEATLSDVTLR